MTIWRIIGLGVLFVAGFAGLQMWAAATYGEGPRVSHDEPAGPIREVAFIANAVGGTVTLADPTSGDSLGTLNVIPDGTRVGFFRDPVQSLAQGVIQGQGGLNFAQDTDLSRDGSVLFVSRGFLADVIALDIATGAILWRTPLAGVRADHMDIAPDGRRLYVSAMIRGGDTVEVLDTVTGRKVGRFKTGQWPHDVHVTPDGSEVWVASLGNMLLDEAERGESTDAYKISVADAETLSVLREYRFDTGVRPFQLSPDERTLYAQLSNTHAIISRDLQTDIETARIDLPVDEGVTEDDWDFEAPHHGLALTPDGSVLCAAGRASDYAALVDAATLTLISTIETGDAPSWSAVTSDGRTCLTANTRSDDVSLVDIAARVERARIPAGRGPKHITIGQVPETVLAALAAD